MCRGVVLVRKTNFQHRVRLHLELADLIIGHVDSVKLVLRRSQVLYRRDLAGAQLDLPLPTRVGELRRARHHVGRDSRHPSTPLECSCSRPTARQEADPSFPRSPRAVRDARELLPPPLSASIPPSLLIIALPCPPGSLKLSTCPNHDTIGLPTYPIATANLQAPGGDTQRHTTPTPQREIRDHTHCFSFHQTSANRPVVRT
jgi:hypothetical protein